MKKRYGRIYGEHWDKVGEVLPVLWAIWVGLGALSFIAMATAVCTGIFQDDWWLIGKFVLSFIAVIFAGLYIGIVWFLISIPTVAAAFGVSAIVCLLTAWYAHANQEEPHSTPVDPPRPAIKPEPQPTPPPPSRPRVTAAQARQRWDELITRLQTVGREIDQVTSSSALRNEFEVLRAAVLHEGSIKLANEQWEDLEIIVTLTHSEISSLSPVERSLAMFGITRNQLTLDRLRQRHRDLAKDHHPDTGPATVPDRMASINESYQVLKKYLSNR